MRTGILTRIGSNMKRKKSPLPSGTSSSASHALHVSPTTRHPPKADGDRQVVMTSEFNREIGYIHVQASPDRGSREHIRGVSIC